MADEQQIYEKHKLLYHYTNEAGLKGILESQCLRAFHFTHLNDSSEISHLQGELKKRLVEPFIEILRKTASNSFRMKREIKKQGGYKSMATLEAAAMVNAYFNITFRSNESNKIIFCEPFITSFCSHIKDDEYVRENGLLSQWRSYAEGGYALVFDTQQLWKLYDREAQEYLYNPLSLGDVVYEGDEEAFQTEFGDFFSDIIEGFREYLLTGEMESKTHLSKVVNAFPRFKHIGFKEEREVRIVASPVDKTLRKALEDEGQTDKKILEKPSKAIMNLESESGGKRYIELLNFQGEHPGLPIKRIIVGPHREQILHAQNARKWINDRDIEIKLSETPYIGRK